MACYLSIEPLDLDHLHTLLKKNNFHNYLKCYCDNLLIGRLNTLITFFLVEDSYCVPYLCHSNLLKVYCNLALENSYT